MWIPNELICLWKKVRKRTYRMLFFITFCRCCCCCLVELLFSFYETNLIDSKFVCVCVLLLRYLYCYYNTNNSTENDIQILFVIIITLSIHHTLHSIHYIYVCVSYFFMSWVRAKISLSNLIIKSITYTSDLFWPFFPHCVCGKCMTFHSSAMTYSITSSRIVKFGK